MKKVKFIVINDPIWNLSAIMRSGDAKVDWVTWNLCKDRMVAEIEQITDLMVNVQFVFSSNEKS